MIKLPLPMKKLVPIIALCVLVVGGGIFFLLRNKQKPAQTPAPTTQKKKVSQPVNVIPVADRPYLQLTPSSDGHYVTITIKELKKDATSMDYEMEYQTGSMLQGFQGVLKITNGQAEEKKLFGSQSAGGAITYHEDITGGTFLAQFDGGADAYAVKSAWRAFDNKEKESTFSSQDTKFTISNQSLAKVGHLFIYNVPGYPGELKKDLLSDPYAVTTDSDLTAISSNFDISIHSSEEGDIWGYTGKEWQKMTTTMKDGNATAQGPFMQVYVLTKK